MSVIELEHSDTDAVYTLVSVKNINVVRRIDNVVYVDDWTVCFETTEEARAAYNKLKDAMERCSN